MKYNKFKDQMKHNSLYSFDEEQDEIKEEE